MKVDPIFNKGKYFSQLVIALIIALGIAAYSNSFKAPFTFDDNHYIVDNYGLQLADLSASEWQGFIASFTRGQGFSVSERFIPFLSFALNYLVGGHKVFGYHLINLLIHLLAAITLYFLLQNILKLPQLKARYEKHAHYLAAGASLLFLLYPVQTETVIFTWQRCTSLAALFYLLTLLCYLKGRTSPPPHRLVYFFISLITAICALFSKQNTATLPLFIILLEVYFIQGINWPQIKSRLGYLLALAGGFLLIAVYYTNLNFTDWVVSGYAKRNFGVLERVLTQLRVVVYYISLLLFPLPSRLNLDYGFPVSQSLTQPLSTLFCLLLIAGLIFIALYLAKRNPLISFSILWLLGNLVIESSVIGLELVYEHRLYLPSVGFYLLLSIGVWELVDRLALKTRLVGAIAIWGIILLTLTIFTHKRNAVWGEELRLWRDVVKKSAEKYRPHSNLAFIYNKLGRYDEAITAAGRALELNPLSYRAANNLGVAYYRKGMFDEARRYYQTALELNPRYADAVNNLGLVYSATGDYQQAIRLFKQTLDMEPDHVVAYNNLGNLYRDQGQLDEAIAQFTKAKQLRPDLAETFNNLGITYYYKKMYPESRQAYEQTLLLMPNHVAAVTNLGVIYYQLGLKDKARLLFDKALKLDPDNLDALINLGVIYSEEGKFKEAMAEYQLALEFDPKNINALANMATVYTTQKRIPEAIELYQQALEINPRIPVLHYLLGDLYERQGNYLEAMNEYDQTLQLNPDFAVAYAKIGFIYRGYGQLESAMEYYLKALDFTLDPKQRQELQKIVRQLKEGIAADKNNTDY